MVSKYSTGEVLPHGPFWCYMEPLRQSYVGRKSMEMNGLVFKFWFGSWLYLLKHITLSVEGWSTFRVILRIGDNVYKMSILCQGLFKSVPCKTHHSHADVSSPVQKIQWKCYHLYWMYYSSVYVAWFAFLPAMPHFAHSDRNYCQVGLPILTHVVDFLKTLL